MSLPSQCPLCSANGEFQNVASGHVYGSQDNHAVFHCNKCSVNYLFPSLNSEEEREFYNKEFEAFMSVRSADDAGWEQPQKHLAANQEQFQRRWRYLKDILPAQGRVLEIGCSSGFMLYPMQKQGWQCVGVEPSGAFGAYVRHNGITCFDSTEELVAQGTLKDGFDIIMHFFVLEHIRNARDFIAEQLGMLKPGGVLVFEVPNADDALVSLYQIPEYDRFIWVVSHNWYFSRASLEYLLGSFDCNAEVRLDQRYDLSNHLVWARDGKPGGAKRFTEHFGPELEKAYKDALIRSGHCDTLIGIIKKPK